MVEILDSGMVLVVNLALHPMGVVGSPIPQVVQIALQVGDVPASLVLWGGNSQGTLVPCSELWSRRSLVLLDFGSVHRCTRGRTRPSS